MLARWSVARRVDVVVALAALVAAAIVGPSTPRSAAAGRVANSTVSTVVRVPCGTVTSVPAYRHVVWILLENEGETVVGSPSAPYLDSIAKRCGLATNDVAVAHPSLPNYLALTSGSTHGITDDADPAAHRLAGPSIFSQLDGDWRAFEQSMPEPCDHVTSGAYAARHNPAVYFESVGTACLHDDLPLPATPDFSAAFTFVTPNICDDMHSCPIASGDAFLARFVPEVLTSPQYRADTLVLFITFDENDHDLKNLVPTYVVAPSVIPGLRVTTALTHYSLLRTTETLLRLGLLGGARSAPSMIGPFRI